MAVHLKVNETFPSLTCTLTMKLRLLSVDQRSLPLYRQQPGIGFPRAIKRTYNGFIYMCYLLQVARTLMITSIPKEISDPGLITKHFQYTCFLLY